MVAAWLMSTTSTLSNTSESLTAKAASALSAAEPRAFAAGFLLTTITLAVMVPLLVVSACAGFFVHLVTKCWATGVTNLSSFFGQRSI